MHGFCNIKELARRANVSVETIRRWRHIGGIVPEPDMQTGAQRARPHWKVETVKKWLATGKF